MEQLQLLLRDKKKNVDISIIENIPTFTAALKMCLDISGLEGKQIAPLIGTDEGNLNRVWSKKNGESGNGTRYFPENKLLQYMEVCQNIIPLIWLALKCGYGLHPLMSEKDKEIEELQAQLAEKDKEIEILAKYKAKGLI